jgi:YHS domain-containing protein
MQIIMTEFSAEIKALPLSFQWQFYRWNDPHPIFSGYVSGGGKAGVGHSPDKGNPYLYVVTNGDVTYANDDNDDTFALLACHELGHVLGGKPYYPKSPPEFNFSMEGQADYFSSSICLPRVLDKIPNKYFNTYIPAETAASLCKDAKDKNLCERIVQAAYAKYKYSSAGSDDLSYVQNIIESYPPSAKLDYNPHHRFIVVQSGAGAALQTNFIYIPSASQVAAQPQLIQFVGFFDAA